MKFRRTRPMQLSSRERRYSKTTCQQPSATPRRASKHRGRTVDSWTTLTFIMCMHISYMHLLPNKSISINRQNISRYTNKPIDQTISLIYIVFTHTRILTVKSRMVCNFTALEGTRIPGSADLVAQYTMAPDLGTHRNWDCLKRRLSNAGVTKRGL
jgi:hypothetical protein